jgi:hypothetical protein
VRDVVTLDLITELSAIGISPQRLAKALVEVHHHQREIARLIIDVYRDDIWAPFVSSGFTTRGWGSIADDVARAKPAAIRLLSHLLDAALDEAAGTVVLRKAGETERAIDGS